MADRRTARFSDLPPAAKAAALAAAGALQRRPRDRRAAMARGGDGFRCAACAFRTGAWEQAQDHSNETGHARVVVIGAGG